MVVRNRSSATATNGSNKASIVDENANVSAPGTAAEKRPRLFEYPALGRWEMRIYFCVWFSIAAYAWYRVWDVSQTYIPMPGNRASFEVSPWPSFFGSHRKDVTNYEWRVWTPWALNIIPWFLGHSLLFNVGERLIGKLWSPVMLMYWVYAAAYLTRWSLIALIIIQGLLLFSVAVISRNRLSIWLTGILFLYCCVEGTYFRTLPLLRDLLNISYEQYLISIIVMSYKHLQYIGFCIEYANSPEMQRKPFFRNLYDMFWFCFYLPYMISVVVTYRDFPSDFRARPSRSRNALQLLLFALRLLFWLVFIEVVQHFFYYDALMQDPRKLRNVDLASLTAIGYVAGQFFQIKYVLIFGLPSLFAKLDKMTPPNGPICISRVAMYSKMWRYFDKGLYSFFKEYIFKAICEPSYTWYRKLTALFVCYGFVLVWHGMAHQYLVWVAMNIVEILLETLGKILYVATPLKQWREKNISDRNFRRILVWFQIFPLCWGLYSTFYFIGGANTGWVFVDRIFWAETVTLQVPFWILITIGYFFVSSCMEVERLESLRKTAQHIE